MLLLMRKDDRSGTNFMCLVTQIIHFHFNNHLPVHFNNSNDNDIALSIFQKLFSRGDSKETWYWWELRQFEARVVMEVKQDLISYFEKHLKPNFSKHLMENSLSLPWQTKKVVAIHLRLDDLVHVADVRCYQSHLEILRRIESGIDGNCDIEASGQAIMKEEKVKILVEKMRSFYPEHEIHIVTSPDGLNVDMSNIGLNPEHLHRDGYNESVWYLVNSDILVGSRSNFAIMAGMLRQGTRVYQPFWGHLGTTGVGGKYDQSNWILFDDVSDENDIIFYEK
jgi:hypothetical protein